MNAQDIMTRSVITVGPDARVSEAANLLFERHISALPVLEAGRLAGIVSEADLLHRHEIGTERSPFESEPWWARLFAGDHSAEDYVRSHARHVRDIMTREVLTVAPDTALAHIANLLEKRRIKRVPVLDGAKLVGIVSRSDLVRALVSARKAHQDPAPRTDEAILRRLLAELQRQAWWRPEFCTVTVERGVVTFRGLLDHENERMAARVAAQNVPGVRRVDDQRLAFSDIPAMT